MSKSCKMKVFFGRYWQREQINNIFSCPKREEERKKIILSRQFEWFCKILLNICCLLAEFFEKANIMGRNYVYELN